MTARIGSGSIPLTILDDLRVASPCPVRWEDMTVQEAGQDRVRHCDHCGLNVYNFANLTRQEAVDLVVEHATEGKRLCGGLYRRADGTLILRDCPVGLAAMRKRTVRWVSRAAAAVLVAASGAMLYAAERGESWHPKARHLEPLRTGAGRLRTIVEQLKQSAGITPPPSARMAGAICLPPIPPNVPSRDDRSRSAFYASAWER